MCIGGDNDSLEVYPCEPGTFLPVHSYMFATAGAQIIESLWLRTSSADARYEVAFIGGPIKFTGATGSHSGRSRSRSRPELTAITPPAPVTVAAPQVAVRAEDQ